MGAVPFQEANRPLSAKRPMSPTSASSLAALEGPMPCSCSRVLPVAAISSSSSVSAVLIPLVDQRRLADQVRGQASAGLADDISRAHRGQQCAGLGRGQELLGPAWDELEQQPVQPVDGLGAGTAELVAVIDQ
jgi:hypothetical protein